MTKLNLMTLHQIADKSGHSLDAIRSRQRRGVLGMEPVALVGQTYVYDAEEAEAWVRENKKEAK